jgi:hypothetical protein
MCLAYSNMLHMLLLPSSNRDLFFLANVSVILARKKGFDTDMLDLDSGPFHRIRECQDRPECTSLYSMYVHSDMWAKSMPEAILTRFRG